MKMDIYKCLYSRLVARRKNDLYKHLYRCFSYNSQKDEIL